MSTAIPPLPPGPPPLPQPPSIEAYLSQPVLSGGKIVSGTQGMTVGQLEDDILQGGKFILFMWNFSVVVMSFRRNSPLTYVRAGEWVGPKALLWSLPSFLIGWWGIPWGIIFTIMSLHRNSMGGQDVTAVALQSLVGPQRAGGILARAPKKAADPVLWFLRLFCLGIPLAIVSVVFAVQINRR